MEKLIAQLRQQVETKDQEIVMLKNNLEQMHVQVAELHEQVSGLNTQVTGLSEAKASLEGEVKGQTDILNTAYYIVGSEKELLDRLQKPFYRPDAEDQREPEPRQLYESRYPSFRQRSDRAEESDARKLASGRIV